MPLPLLLATKRKVSTEVAFFLQSVVSSRRKKIGRAAPVGLGYREKKRYRSPLVSL